jgi:hypothetical protein
MESAAFGKRGGNAAKADTGRAVLRGQFSAAKAQRIKCVFSRHGNNADGVRRNAGLPCPAAVFRKNGFFTSVMEVCEREETKTFERE